MRTCVAVGCERIIPITRLMCAKHWFMVPLKVRNRIWDLYKANKVGEPAYSSAVQDAVKAVERREAERAGARS